MRSLRRALGLSNWGFSQARTYVDVRAFSRRLSSFFKRRATAGCQEVTSRAMVTLPMVLMMPLTLWESLLKRGFSVSVRYVLVPLFVYIEN